MTKTVKIIKAGSIKNAIVHLFDRAFFMMCDPFVWKLSGRRNSVLTIQAANAAYMVSDERAIGVSSLNA